MSRPSKLLFPTLLASLLLGGVGCESDNGDDHHRRADRDHISDRYDDDVRHDRRIDDDDAILASGRGLSGIPRNARRVDAAQGTTEMMYEARRDSTIYVYDVDANRVVYTGSLGDGDRFVLDPNDNLALINGRKVLDRDLKSRHVFRLYVLEDRDRARY